MHRPATLRPSAIALQKYLQVFSFQPQLSISVNKRTDTGIHQPIVSASQTRHKRTASTSRYPHRHSIAPRTVWARFCAHSNRLHDDVDARLAILNDQVCIHRMNRTRARRVSATRRMLSPRRIINAPHPTAFVLTATTPFKRTEHHEREGLAHSHHFCAMSPTV